METPPPKSRGAQLSDAVYDWITKNTSASTPKVNIDFEADITTFGRAEKDLATSAYPFLDDLSRTVWMSFKKAIASTLESLKADSHRSQSSHVPEAVIEAFQAEYLSDTAQVFYEYVLRCWNAYAECTDDFFAPYTIIVQSSGFGKVDSHENWQSNVPKGPA